jgi:hypothetical protein
VLVSYSPLGTVSDNAIRLTQTAWTVNPGAGGANLGNPSGIFLNPDNNLPTQNILISDNIVEYDLEGSSYPWDNAGFGIGYWDANENQTVDGLRIIDNTIMNCPLPAVRVHVDGKNIEVSGNQIVNPGSTQNGSATSGFRSGIFLANTNNPAINVRVNNNTITDTNSTTRMVYGLLIENQSGSDVVALGNTISCSGGTTTAFTSFATVSSGINPVLQFTQVNPALNGDNLPTNVGQCSIAYDPRTGKTYTVNPNGINWSATSYGTAAPSGSLFANAGDLVVNTSPSAGGFSGWRCTASGTPGTWCPILLADTGGNLVLGGQPDGQYLAYRTAAGVNRWVMIVADAETGSNAGSDFFLNNYDDSGNQLGVALEIVRSTGEVIIAHGLAIGGTTPDAAAGEIAFGGETGEGNGSSGTAVTTTAQGTGTGPATPQTVVKYLKLNIAGSVFWLPLFQ